MPVNIKANEENELVPKLIKMISDTEQAYDTRMKIAKEHYKNYNSIRSKRFYNGRSDIFVPFSKQVVDTLVARIIQAIFSQPVIMSLQGVGPTDKDREERLRALLHMQQKKTVKLWAKLQDYWKSKAMYGRGYAKMDWRTEYRTIKKSIVVDKDGNKIDNLTRFQTPSPEEEAIKAESALLDAAEEAGGMEPIKDISVDLPGGIKESAEEVEDRELKKTLFTIKEGGIPDDRRIKVTTEEERVVVYDCWDFVNLDFFDVLVDPMAPDGDIQRAKFAIVRSLISDDELEEWGNRTNAEGKPIFEMWQDSVGAGEGEFAQDLIDRKRLLGLNVDHLQNMRDDQHEHHELHEIYMDYKFEGDKYVSKNALFFLLDRRVIIRAEKNPWWHGKKPIISGPYDRRQNEFLGQGALDPIRKIQYEINDKRNQELDYATLTLAPVWLVGDAADLDDENIRISSTTALRVGDIDAIRPITFPDMTPVGQRAEAILEQNLRETTGITRSVQGVSEPGRQTATEFNRLIAQADQRINMILEAFGQQEWPEMWEMAHSLNQQFLKEDTFVRITEREGRELKLFGTEGQVTEADLAMDVDFLTPSFNDLESEITRNQQIIPFFQIVNQLPPSVGNNKFFNMFMEKYWVDILKMPREDLLDDDGEPFLLSPAGHKSIYDTSIKQEIADGIAAQTPVAEGGAVPPNANLAPQAAAQQLGGAAGQVATGGAV